MRCQCPECPDCKNKGVNWTSFANREWGRRKLCWPCWSDWIRKVQAVPNEESQMIQKKDEPYIMSPIPVIVLLVAILILVMVWLGMMGVAQNAAS